MKESVSVPGGSWVPAWELCEIPWFVSWIVSSHACTVIFFLVSLLFVTFFFSVYKRSYRADIFLQMMSRAFDICILKGKKWDVFHTVYPTKPGENLYRVEKWAYHVNFAVFFRWKSANSENGNSLSFLLPPPATFFFKDFPDTFMAILVGLIGKSMQTSVRTTSLLISTDKRVLYKELYRSCTSFQIPKAGLTEEISLCKSTLLFFFFFFPACEILLPFPNVHFFLNISAHTAFDRSVMCHAARSFS